MTTERIAELRALAEAATPGPWRVPDCDPDTVGSPAVDRLVAECSGPEVRIDAQLIAAARTALPEALDEIERLRTLLVRIVKYATEDRARTPGSTRLARAIEEARKMLEAP